jgi:hypothetical protein
MQTPKSKRPFIPRDKPKSWVIGILAGLCGFFIASPIVLVGHFLAIEILKSFGTILFFTFIIIMMVMLMIFFVDMVSGHHRNIKNRDWKDQVW